MEIQILECIETRHKSDFFDEWNSAGIFFLDWFFFRDEICFFQPEKRIMMLKRKLQKNWNCLLMIPCYSNLAIRMTRAVVTIRFRLLEIWVAEPVSVKGSVNRNTKIRDIQSIIFLQKEIYVQMMIVYLKNIYTKYISSCKNSIKAMDINKTR